MVTIKDKGELPTAEKTAKKTKLTKPKPPLKPLTLEEVYAEIAALARAHEGPIDIGYQELVFRHAIQQLEKPTTPWQIAQSIPGAIRNNGITDAEVLDSLMGVNGAYYRLQQADALTQEERAKVRDLRGFLGQSNTYHGLLEHPPSAQTLRQVVNTGITVMETMPGDYSNGERAIILTGGLKYIAEGIGFYGTRNRIPPQFSGRWDSLGVSSTDIMFNQHLAVTQYKPETSAFVVLYHTTAVKLREHEANFPIHWPSSLPKQTPAVRRI